MRPAIGGCGIGSGVEMVADGGVAKSDIARLVGTAPGLGAPASTAAGTGGGGMLSAMAIPLPPGGTE
jgi:hypothetical protein